MKRAGIDNIILLVSAQPLVSVVPVASLWSVLLMPLLAAADFTQGGPIVTVLPVAWTMSTPGPLSHRSYTAQIPPVCIDSVGQMTGPLMGFVCGKI